MSDDFYDDDEPVEDVLAAWHAATEGGITAGQRTLSTADTIILERWHSR